MVQDELAIPIPKSNLSNDKFRRVRRKRKLPKVKTSTKVLSPINSESGEVHCRPSQAKRVKLTEDQILSTPKSIRLSSINHLPHLALQPSGGNSPISLTLQLNIF